MMTIKPVTLGGWYENVDGSVSLYTWRAGRLDCDRTVATWADVPSREDDLRADMARLMLNALTVARRELDKICRRMYAMGLGDGSEICRSLDLIEAELRPLRDAALAAAGRSCGCSGVPEPKPDQGRDRREDTHGGHTGECAGGVPPGGAP